VYVSDEWWDKYLDAHREWDAATKRSIALLQCANDSQESAAEAEIAQRELQRLYKKWRDLAETI
jgi:hypothetical protein